MTLYPTPPTVFFPLAVGVKAIFMNPHKVRLGALQLISSYIIIHIRNNPPKSITFLVTINLLCSLLYINLPLPHLLFHILVKLSIPYHFQWLSPSCYSQSQPSSLLTSSTNASVSSSLLDQTPGLSSETSAVSRRWGSGASRSGRNPMAPSCQCGWGRTYTW